MCYFVGSNRTAIAAKTQMRRYSSGQRGQTVNLLASPSKVRIPPGALFKNQLRHLPGRFLLVRREVKCLGDILRGIRRPCQLFYDARK